MQQYQPGNNWQQQDLSFQSDFNSRYGQNKKQQKKEQPLISFKYHPGFLCFFQDYVNQQGWTFYECYQKVFQSHHQMIKRRFSTQSIVKDEKKSNEQKIKQLINRAQKDKKFLFYVKNNKDELKCNVIVNQDVKIEKINALQKQLQKLQKHKQKIIQIKKQQFQRKQKQKLLQKQKQNQSVVSQKHRRANLVRQIQRQQQQKRRDRFQQRVVKQAQKDIANRGELTKCQIM